MKKTQLQRVEIILNELLNNATNSNPINEQEKYFIMGQVTAYKALTQQIAWIKDFDKKKGGTV